ncbi:MAG: hypothetical protein OER77_05860 [Myxococcales bacterium]|nr:hypothetical protein [Myxococcales bacterium]
MFRRFVIRDVSILLLTIGLWLFSLETEPGTTLASVVSISAGVGAAVCAYNFHEWGHLVAARMTDSVFTPARRVISPFLFSYDAEHNTRRQFLLMSLGGFAATAIFVVAFLLWMPQDQQAGRVALRGGLILASLTVIIEFPIFFRALLGNTVPRTGLFKGPTVGGRQKNTP